ncbi:MAG TPA: riboflavin kinase [Candidatus Paceibacterota bacterium]|nr:riboflavin kinase [Candidatus Paceibacterota bacterium]
MIFRGMVQRGSGYGRKLGFPTANIPCPDDALSGIYAAWVRHDDTTHAAAVYVDTKRKLLEAHLLDVDLDLYGKEIEMTLVRKIREDRTFESAEEAKATIAADVDAVRAVLRV